MNEKNPMKGLFTDDRIRRILFFFFGFERILIFHSNVIRLCTPLLFVRKKNLCFLKKRTWFVWISYDLINDGCYLIESISNRFEEEKKLFTKND